MSDKHTRNVTFNTKKSPSFASDCESVQLLQSLRSDFPLIALESLLISSMKTQSTGLAEIELSTHLLPVSLNSELPTEATFWASNVTNNNRFLCDTARSSCRGRAAAHPPCRSRDDLGFLRNYLCTYKYIHLNIIIFFKSHIIYK